MRVSMALGIALWIWAGTMLAQESDSARVERLKKIDPELLGHAYLINENTLRLLAMARQGATLKLSGEDSTRTVTTANVDPETAEYERRRATYAAVIRARGFATLAGEYEIALKRCPSATEPALATLAQQEFLVTMDGDGGGVVVERTLVWGQGDGSDGSYRHGRVGEGKVELRPLSGKGCTLVLAPYRRPDVRLDRPERLIGRWEGRWDGEFDVRFTITPTDSGYSLLYEWVEYRGGAFNTRTAAFHPSSKNSIRGGAIEITAEQDGEHGARAVGAFSRKRTAKLKRVPGP